MSWVHSIKKALLIVDVYFGAAMGIKDMDLPALETRLK